MAEPRSRQDILYSIRIFPVQEAVAVKLEAEFPDLASTRRFLPRLDGWNLVLDIAEGTDIEPVVRALRRDGLETNFDIFISLVPETDSIIREVPRNVVRMIQEFGCPIMVSYTSGTWASQTE
jgi:hypothetical protein